MKTITFFLGGCAVLALVATSQAALKVEESADGGFNVLRDGVAVATGFRPILDREVPFQKSSATLKDGTRVWNRWNTDKNDNFRFEVAERADGAVEISLLGYSVDKVTNRKRGMSFGMPGKVFDGQPYEAMNRYRLYSQSSKGVMNAEMKPLMSRYFTAAGLVFNCDACPVGNFSNPGTRTGIPGEWTFEPDGKGDFKSSLAAMLPKEGNGDAGLKIVIHEGTFKDYDKDHFLKSFNIYWDSFVPLHLVKFGAPKAGGNYKDGNCPFEKSFGWVGQAKQKVVVGNPSGAYYSHACGNGKATYRFGQLHPGYYILTCQLGNYTGEKNAFSISVNGEKLATDVSVKKGEARTVARTFHVDGDRIDVVFDGDWLVSGIGLQPLLSDQEDHYMRRGFFCSEGYEPSFGRRNDYARPFKPATFDQTTAMPVPGQETSARFRDPPRPVELVDMSKPENQWMYELKMRNVGLGGQALTYSNDAQRAAYIDESAKLHYNAFMLHGTICRHNMAPAVRKTVDEQILKFTQDAHKRGLKFIDHIDITLGWANDYGFRTLIEQLDKAMLDVNDNLPSYVYCLENPSWKRQFFKYLRKKVADGIDGFQLDELTYWKLGCGCAHCRAKFAAETGWQFPLDETDPSCRHGALTELGQRWREWQAGNITNWRIDLRRFTKDLNPNLYMSSYNTYAGQVGRSCSIAGFMESARTMSMLGTEVMQQDVMRCGRSLMTLARVKNVFRLAFGTPSWNWYYNSNYANECFAFAVSSMTGEVPLLTGTWLGAVYDPAFADPVEWASKSRPMKLAGAYPLAQVGLLFSYQSCRNNEGDNHTPEILGLGQELENLHVPYEFLGDRSCTFEQLRNYKALFIGDAQCLSDAEIQAMMTFRARGGRIYGRPGCGTRDEMGRKRSVAFSGYEVMPSAIPFYEAEKPEFDAKTAKRFSPDPVLRATFRKEIAGYVGDASWWKVEGAPDMLYTSVFREASGEIVAHFLNATGCDSWENGHFVWRKSMARYPALKEDVFFEVPTTVGGDAVALSPDFGTEERKLEKTVTAEGRWCFRLPKEWVKVYTIVRFDGGKGAK